MEINVSNLKRDILLLLQTPKNYLYSLITVPDEPVRIKEYDPKAEVIANDVMEKIRQSIKGVKVEFVGSAALKLPGYKDIDLFIPVTASKLSNYEATLIELFGEPEKRRKHFSEWKFMKNGFSVELELMDKAYKAYTEQRKVFDVLKRNRKLREMYKNLKLSSIGISKKEYQKRRMFFYNSIVNNY